MTTAVPITPAGESAHTLAERKARYGHRDWIVWRDETGTAKAAPRTTGALEQAIRESATRGYFHHYGASSGVSYLITPDLAVPLLENTRRGHT